MELGTVNLWEDCNDCDSVEGYFRVFFTLELTSQYRT